ncbi:MAG: zinc ribbon domain-containing protein [Methanomassiliicoccaceae archaeon]|nr:zinc ribbon domain-containing protein [Methanomassiliicoccaceae archaeon]
MPFCTKCGSYIGDSNYCNRCGAAQKDDIRYCVNCGKEVGGAGSCTYCGSRRFTGYDGPAKEAAPYRTKSRAGIIVGVVLLLIFAGGGIYFLANAHYAHISIYVHSTHIIQTVDSAIYVDGSEEYTYSGLKPGSYWYPSHMHKVTFPITDDSRVVTVKAVSWGGGLGTQTDTETIVVEHGGRYTVHLYV